MTAGTSKENAIFETLPKRVKTLWISSTGGHLAELLRIERALSPSEDSLWITFDSPQSRSTLGDRRRVFVDYVAPRDIGGVIKAARTVQEVLAKERFELCLSTGAAVAAAGLPLGALRGIPTYYVESVARTDGPSRTGRLMALTPGVKTLTQHGGWATRRWAYDGAVLDTFDVGPVSILRPIRRILVTLGTIRPYRFDRAVQAVLDILEGSDEVTWQLGATTGMNLPGTVLGEVGMDELGGLAAAADVVVSHAGVGSILQLLGLGKIPVLVVRSGQFGEHVDEHQRLIAEAMRDRGLGRVLDLAAPDRRVLEQAASHKAIVVNAPAAGRG
jgi:UDP-N-acetylglucosamine--N-acetylmuramyl-(pentapeptide) pyrophosphoryl-undecaprenol N-acetylglucosamine transferase